MPATLAPERLARPAVIVAAYPFAAEIGVGGLLLALARATIPVTIVVLAPRLLPGPERPDAPPERALGALNESAAEFGADIETLDFSQQTIRDDPVAVAQLAQILRRRRPGNVLTHPAGSANPDYAASHAIAWRAAVLARSGGGLIAGPPLEKSLELWSFGDPDARPPRTRFATGEFAGRKYELLARIDKSVAGPLPDPEQIARDLDLIGGGPTEVLHLAGQPW